MASVVFGEANMTNACFAGRAEISYYFVLVLREKWRPQQGLAIFRFKKTYQTIMGKAGGKTVEAIAFW